MKTFIIKTETLSEIIGTAAWCFTATVLSDQSDSNVKSRNKYGLELIYLFI